MACSPGELNVPGSIPGVDYYSLQMEFSTFSSLTPTLDVGLFFFSVSVFHFLRSLLETRLYSSFHLLSWALMQAGQKTQMFPILSLFTITVSVGTQLSGQNWCCSSPVEAEKNQVSQMRNSLPRFVFNDVFLFTDSMTMMIQIQMEPSPWQWRREPEAIWGISFTQGIKQPSIKNLANYDLHNVDIFNPNHANCVDEIG